MAAHRMLISLGVLVAAGASQSACEGEACLATQSLLQTASQGRRGMLLLGLEGSSRMQEQADYVENLAYEFVHSGKKLGPKEIEALNKAKEAVSQMTLPNIEKEHNADQQAVNDAAKALDEECNSDLDTAAVKVSEGNKAAGIAKQLSDTCADQQAELQKDVDDAMKALKAFVDELKGASSMCQLPSTVVNYDQAKASLGKSLGQMKGEEKKYKELRKTLDDAKKALAGKTEECNKLRGDYEKKYCPVEQSASDSSSTYETCFTRRSGNYDKVLAAAQANAKNRKVDFAGVKHMLCFIDVLMAADEEAGDKLVKCKAEEVDTSHLDIEEAELPPKKDAAKLLAYDKDDVEC